MNYNFWIITLALLSLSLSAQINQPLASRFTPAQPVYQNLMISVGYLFPIGGR